MDVKKAVSIAKAYVADLYADEPLSALGLEEVERDEPRDEWHVTIGFNRTWPAVRGKSSRAALIAPPMSERRSYKLVTIDATGNVLSMKERFPAEAAE